MTLEEARHKLEEHFWYLVDGSAQEPVGHDDHDLYSAVMTMFAVLDYADKLIDRFGSLEEALEAEKVVHCWECGVWKPERGICNKPYESMRCRCPDEYCSDGRYYRKSDKGILERLAEIADKFDRVNPISPKELRKALEIAEKAQKWTVSEEEDSNG